MNYRIFIYFASLYVVTIAKNAKLSEINTYRAFCEIEGPRYPLAVAHRIDKQIRNLEAAFWGFIWIGHVYGAISIYDRIYEMLGGIHDPRRSTSLVENKNIHDHDLGIMATMLRAIQTMDNGRTPMINNSEHAKAIVALITQGKYERALQDIDNTLMKTDPTLASLLTDACLIARFPRTIYSLATDKVLVTGSPGSRQNTALLAAVRSAYYSRDDITKINYDVPLAELVIQMRVYWAAGITLAAFEISQVVKERSLKMLEDPKLLDQNRIIIDEFYFTATEIIASIQLCSMEYSNVNAAKDLYGELYGDGSKGPSNSVAIGMALSRLGLNRDQMIELYSKFAVGGESYTIWPLTKVGPAFPAGDDRVKPLLKEELLLEEAWVKILRGPMQPPITTIVINGEQIEVDPSKATTKKKIFGGTSSSKLLEKPFQSPTINEIIDQQESKRATM